VSGLLQDGGHFCVFEVSVKRPDLDNVLND